MRARFRVRARVRARASTAKGPEELGVGGRGVGGSGAVEARWVEARWVEAGRGMGVMGQRCPARDDGGWGGASVCVVVVGRAYWRRGRC